MSDTPVAVRTLGDPTTNELDQLLEKYQESGLVADRILAGNRSQAIKTLRGDPIAISVCRILNDFRPLDRIVDSLWEAASAKQREVYLACALAHRCHGAGVRQTVVQMLAGSDSSVDNSLGTRCPLPLARHPTDDDFLLPQSAVVAEHILNRISKQDRDLMVKVFTEPRKLHRCTREPHSGKDAHTRSASCRTAFRCGQDSSPAFAGTRRRFLHSCEGCLGVELSILGTTGAVDSGSRHKNSRSVCSSRRHH